MITDEAPYCTASGREFFYYYGAFMTVWSSLEMTMEIAIMRVLGISAEDAHITLSSLGFGTKANVLQSLLAKDPEKNSESIRLLKEAITVGTRNAIVHSLFSIIHEEPPRFSFLRREVKNRISVREKKMRGSDMKKHFEDFSTKTLALQRMLGIADSDYNDYGRKLIRR
jgi:hypothetical protein